jgi:hypothetical protein
MATKNEILTKVLAALKTARAELRAFFDRTINAAEAGAPKAIAKARELTAKLDEGLNKTLETAEAKLVKPVANENQAPKAA